MREEHNKYLVEMNLSKDALIFKTYRDSDEGKEALNEIFSIVKTKILKHFSVIGRSFSKTDI
jgi:DNA-binding PadR family transcriptional regulator